MPVFTIETPSGRKLDIEAPDENVAIKGAQEWEAHNPAKGTLGGVADAFRQGLAGTVSGVGETLKQTGIAPSAGEAAKKFATENLAPNTPVDTSLVTSDGVNAGNVPKRIAEGAPGFAATLTAAKLAAKASPGGLKGKIIGGLLGAIGAQAGMSFGDKVVENAKERTGEANAEPTTADKVRAGLTTAVEAPVGALGTTAFLPGAGPAVSTGAKGLISALKTLGVKAADNAVASGGQNLIAQAGKTIGTDKGLRIDPIEALDSAAGGGVTGGAFGAPKSLSDMKGAIRDRHFGGANADASAQVANRIKTQSDNDSSNLKNVKSAAQAVTAAKSEIAGELKREIAGLTSRLQLGDDSVNALDRAQSGTATKADFAHIADVTKQDAASERVVQLARQARVMNHLLSQGRLENGKFKGGVSALMERQVRAIANPIGAATVAGGTALASAHLPLFGMYSMPALGAAAGSYVLARGLDRLSGARSPAARFTQKFADPTAGVRPDVSAPPPSPGVGPTGPGVPLPPPSPWGEAAVMPDTKQLLQRMKALEMSRKAVALRERQQNASTVREAMPLIKQLSGTAEEPAAPAAPAPEPAPQSPLLPKDIAANSRTLARALANAQKLKPQAQPEQAPAPAPSPALAPAPESPAVLPKDVTANAKTLLRGLQTVQKIKKANGKVEEHAAKVEAEAKSDAYVPMTDLPYKGMSPAKIAEQAVKDYAPAVRKVYGNTVEKTQTLRRQLLTDLAEKHPGDEGALGSLLDQLQHLSRSKRDDVKKAVEHYANQMSPEAAADVRTQVLNPKFFNEVWGNGQRRKR